MAKSRANRLATLLTVVLVSGALGGCKVEEVLEIAGERGVKFCAACGGSA